MSSYRIARLEAQLERLIEGAFAQLFGVSLRPHDIAIHLSRALEDQILPPTHADPRPIAPNQFVVRLNPQVYDHLLIRKPDLAQMLGEHITALSSASGCRLHADPNVVLIADETLRPGDLRVEAAHQKDAHQTTQIMNASLLERALASMPRNPVLVIDGETTIPLVKAIINVGRGRDNEIVLSDPYVSRRHAQLRLRDGAFFVFDADSQSGLSVNDVAVREHRLQPGDVLRIGRTHLLYLEDASPGEEQTAVLAPQDV